MTSAAPAGVDFFARQHAARGTTVRLVVLFALALVCILAIVDAIVFLVTRSSGTGTALGWVIAATLATLAIIGGGTLAKLAVLRGGGAAVALSVGAVPVDATSADPQLRRFVNVVEEMSIASGVPMPRLFVLPREAGINAFAAGYTTSDAAITVTAGALQRLNRDELQGVIGHEFSHVLNGDMRLNVRLVGLLAGLLLLGLVGLRILQFGGGGRRDKNGAAILLFGVAALILGFVGQFFAGLIKAAVSRQREWLADASAVQFTRQSVGLAGALKKIAGVEGGSALADAHSEKQINHMLFGEGGRSISQLWATHPPLVKRIQALEPGFSATEIPQLQQRFHAAPPNGLAEDRQRGLVGDVVPAAVAATSAPAATPRTHLEPDSLARRVGTFTTADLDRGAAISRAVAPHLRELAGQPSASVPLVLALLLDRGDSVRSRQLADVAQALGPDAAAAADRLRIEMATLPDLHRLPLVGLALPAFVTRPRQQVDVLLRMVDALVAADGTATVFEYCLSRLVGAYVRDTLDPARRSQPGRATVAAVQDAAVTVLAVVALEGNPDPSARERAFRAGLARLDLPPRPFVPPADVVRALDAAWPPLDGLDPRHKRPLIDALAAAIADDGVLAVAEAELLRTACALLHCPVPALLS